MQTDVPRAPYSPSVEVPLETHLPPESRYPGGQSSRPPRKNGAPPIRPVARKARQSSWPTPPSEQRVYQTPDELAAVDASRHSEAASAFRAGRQNVQGHLELEAMVTAYMCHAPMALALREINRLLAIDSLPPQRGGKVLDVGCGDGFWWTIRKRGDCAVYGVDIDEREVELASERIRAEVCDVACQQPFAEERFDEIIGNCSLEHVHDIEAALRNLRRCAAPNARLVLFVPSQMWAYQGRLQRSLLRRSPRLGMALGGLMNGFFQHWHVYDVAHWSRLLAATGWRLEQSSGLGNPRSEFLFRLLLPQAFGSFLWKKASGEYPSRLLGQLPASWLRAPRRLLTWALQDPLVAANAPTAYEYMLVAELGPEVEAARHG